MKNRYVMNRLAFFDVREHSVGYHLAKQNGTKHKRSTRYFERKLLIRMGYCMVNIFRPALSLLPV
jgi:hypothetical protein